MTSVFARPHQIPQRLLLRRKHMNRTQHPTLVLRGQATRVTPIGLDAITRPARRVGNKIQELLSAIQMSLLDAALHDRERRTLSNPDSYREMIEFLPEARGFVFASWCGSGGVALPPDGASQPGDLAAQRGRPPLDRANVLSSCR